jgi:hypothetical protein
MLETRIETEWRWVDVRTGRRECHTVDGKKRCWPEYRRSFRPFTYARTVDLNRARRDNLVALCTQEACLGKYGDLECDPDAGKR